MLSAVVLAAVLGAEAPSSAPHVIAAPDYASTPRGEDVVTYYPKAAAAANIEGRATIDCTVDEQGLLRGCIVLNEEPAGAGFGAAALRLSPLFKMRPMTKDGVPVAGGAIRIPIRFALPKDEPSWLPAPVLAMLPPDAVVIEQVEFRQAGVSHPTVSTELNPPARGQDGVAARVDLKCRAVGETRVKNCAVVFEDAIAPGFGALSLKIAEKLRVRPAILGLSTKAGDLFVLPLTYRGVSSPASEFHVFVSPDWARKPDARDIAHPAAAAKVASKVSLSCFVSAEGHLAPCKITHEEPPSMGFGEAALRSSRIFKFWPAMLDGRPVDGVGVTVPVETQAFRLR